jgi:hypothetical protein
VRRALDQAACARGSFLGIAAAGLQDDALGVKSTAGRLAGLVGGLVAFATLVWYVVLGASLARRIGFSETAGKVAVSCAGCPALIIRVSVVLVGMGVLHGGSAYGGTSPAYYEWP